MSYDYYLDQCHEDHFREDEHCDDCGHMKCRCDDNCGDEDDYDADDYETVYDYETNKLEVI